MNEHTRRNWIVTISQAAVGFGIAGTFEIEGQQVFELPPGLYGPSSEHLGHALMSAEPFHFIPPECPTDYIRPRSDSFKPLFFSHAEFAALRKLVQLMLGEPSSSATAVVEEISEWVDLQVSRAGEIRAAAARLNSLQRGLATAYYGSNRIAELERSNLDTICREGLAWIDKNARDKYGSEFLALPENSQLVILDAVSDRRPDLKAKNSGTLFFAHLKNETIKGFYTSRAGLQELDFKGNAFYARSPGCDSKTS